jgi:hypothetical protein
MRTTPIFAILIVYLLSGGVLAATLENPSDSNAVPTGDATVSQPGPNAKPAPSVSDQRMCALLGSMAAQNDLPLEFFWRLIWQESNFDPRAVSNKGALGIAQFMPETARWRGLADPFEPNQALFESARWLRELLDQFGNLGLAAAAYNAGPARIQDWLLGRGPLPSETREYVRIITDRSAEEWARAGVQQPSDESKRTIPCSQLVKLIRPVGEPRPRDAIAANLAEWQPWGLQLAGDWSESKVLAMYDALQKKFPSVLGDRQPLILKNQMAGRGSALWYRIRVAEQTREAANRLCAKLEAAGGSCIVLRN